MMLNSSLELLDDTPAIVIDLPRLRRNIARVQRLADEHEVSLWPHVKTHKSAKIAALQIGAGAHGLTVAKPDEAISFIGEGFRDILVAYPGLSRAKVERVLAAAGRDGARLSFTADSMRGVLELAAAASSAGVVLPVLVKVDVGLHRCGVTPDGPELLAVARGIADTPALQLAGLLSHAGQSYGAADLSGVREVAALERDLMLGCADLIEQHGLPRPPISVGATPTVLAHAGLAGIHQIRPGNYVFCDLTQVRLGIASLEELALHVVASVVSRGRDWAVLDAGSKTLSSDRAPHSSNGLQGYGLVLPEEFPHELSSGLRVDRLSEEHAVVADPKSRLRIGERVRVYPNHACPVMNLADRVIVVDGSAAPQIWPVTARACVR